MATTKRRAPRAERPLIFSDEMVRAIIDGRKTQTRRICRCQDIGVATPPDRRLKGPIGSRAHALHGEWSESERQFWLETMCERGKIGNRFWIREAWGYFGGEEYIYQREQSAVMYRATWLTDSRRPVSHSGVTPLGDRKWRTPVFMPRWASRLTIELTEIRIERVQDISDADAIAEGLYQRCGDVYPAITEYSCGDDFWTTKPRIAFQRLWMRINGKASWDANPFVWPLSFKKL